LTKFADTAFLPTMVVRNQLWKRRCQK